MNYTYYNFLSLTILNEETNKTLKTRYNKTYKLITQREQFETKKYLRDGDCESACVSGTTAIQI